ncbi:MAG: methanogenesis marker 9 domain-containing protein [Methanomicrobiales archaeon]|nr:methanogenesis marker 9 domain-containing protein [Methanomicrobiales archaeon]
MMAAYERFGLLLNDQVVRTPIAIASMAGTVDAKYVLARAAHVGVGFIGGYSIDPPTLDASRKIAACGRGEFLYEDPIEELSRQLHGTEGSDVIFGLNLRGSTPASFTRIAEAFGDKVIYEIDAHCRQEPMLAAQSGEYFLDHPDLLSLVIHELKKHDVTVSVKMRAGVSPSDPQLAQKLWEAGADILHVDLMDLGYLRLKQIRNACNATLIANNGLFTFDRMMEMFSHGADLISVARRSDEETLGGLDAAITRYTDDNGWYNAPKQLCRGGDLRALTFCCLPVKRCPLLPQLQNVRLDRDEYIALKIEAVKGTPLEDGQFTCFGSLTWCCKATSPCHLRDSTLRKKGLSRQEYMRLKRTLSERIMHHVFHRPLPAYTD